MSTSTGEQQQHWFRGRVEAVFGSIAASTASGGRGALCVVAVDPEGTTREFSLSALRKPIAAAPAPAAAVEAAEAELAFAARLAERRGARGERERKDDEDGRGGGGRSENDEDEFSFTEEQVGASTSACTCIITNRSCLFSTRNVSRLKASKPTCYQCSSLHLESFVSTFQNDLFT